MEEQIIDYLDELLEESTLKNVYVIEYKGARLTMGSRKSSWATLGAAKNALRNELPTFYHECPDTWRTRLTVLKELEDKEIIKYIKL